MIRDFSKITLGKIIEELKAEGVDKMSRSSFYRRERDLDLPQPPRTERVVNGKKRRSWRYYTRDMADKIKRLIKQSYGLPG